MTSPAFDAYWQQLAEIARAKLEPMERMCRYIGALGYTFEECCIKSYPELNGAVRDVLVVRGEPVFEVLTTITAKDPVITYHITPKVLSWPAHP